jgi:dihydrofolate reductase
MSPRGALGIGQASPHKATMSSLRTPRIELIVARADNGVIGRDGRVPWHLPTDLRHFRTATMGAPMIIGRKTFDGLPGLLPGREHIVLTHNPAWQRQGVKVAHSREAALQCAAGHERVSVIGGEETYREFLPLAERIHMTEVHIAPDGDAFFPKFDPRDWAVARGRRAPKKGEFPAHTFVLMERKDPSGA